MTAIFGLPAVSMLLFILAGILIGHLLWFHDPTSEKQKIRGLENRYVKARGSARQRKQESVKLQKNLDAQHQDLKQRETELEQIAADVTAEAQQLLQQRDSAEGNLKAQQEQYKIAKRELNEIARAKAAVDKEIAAKNQIIVQLQESNQQNQSEIEQLRTSVQLLSDSNDETAQRSEQTISELTREFDSVQQTHQETLAVLQQTQLNLQSRTDELNASIADRDALSDQLNATMNQVTVIESEMSHANGIASERDSLRLQLESANATIESQATLVQQLEEELADLRKQVVKSSQVLDQQRIDYESLTATLLEREFEIVQITADKTELSAGQEAFRQQIVSLETQLQDLESMRQGLVLAASEQQNHSESLQLQMTQRDDQITQLNAQVAELNDQVAEIAPLQTELASATLELRGQREARQQTEVELSEAMKRLDDVTARGETLQATLRQQESEMETFQRQQAEEMAEWQQQLESRDELVSQMQIAADSSRDTIAQNELQLGELTATHQQLEVSFQDQRQHVSHLEKTISGLQAEIANRSQEIASLQQNVSRLESELETRTEQHNASITDLMGRLKQVSAEHEDSLEANAKAHERVRQLENEIHASVEKIRDLRRSRASIADLKAVDGGEIRRAA